MELTIRPTSRGWIRPKAAAAYAGVTPRVFYRWLKEGLRHSKLPSGRILVSFDAVDDEYLGNYEVTDGEIQFPDKVEQAMGAIKQKMRKGHGSEKKNHGGNPHPAGTGLDYKKGGVPDGT